MDRQAPHYTNRQKGEESPPNQTLEKTEPQHEKQKQGLEPIGYDSNKSNSLPSYKTLSKPTVNSLKNPFNKQSEKVFRPLATDGVCTQNNIVALPN